MVSFEAHPKGTLEPSKGTVPFGKGLARTLACVRACMRACVHVCAYMCACVRVCVACVHWMCVCQYMV